MMHDEQVFSHTKSDAEKLSKKSKNTVRSGNDNESNRNASTNNKSNDHNKSKSQTGNKNVDNDNGSENANDTDRKKIFIVGDSLLNGINENGMKKLNCNIKVRNHPGATTEDLLDHIKPILRKQPDVLIIHGGTNDLTNDIDTTKSIENMNKLIKKISPNTKFVVSKLIRRKDKAGMEKKVNDLNASIERSCKQMNVETLSNDNIMEGNLSTKKLHLNKSGNSKLAQNLIKFVRDLE